ncbi:DoxX family protein [Neorhizobium sp. NCHU2750]|uniref:DoxX family protein n=1 Tax=Neorhizobium sp. NCHU2750 TaxID=1825976 RepID=UPI000E727922|nr:hypothetical protein NCHU2750_53050 [Neorhizobium sp. NCHU2750]
MTEVIRARRQRTITGLSIVYAIAGILHLALPRPFLAITPGWVPHPGQVIFVTGLCEIAGAIGLWTPRLNRLAGVALALYAFCVFPANIKHALDSLQTGDPSVWEGAYHLVRLPLQPVIIWAALFAGGVVRWPVRSGRAGDDREAQ